MSNGVADIVVHSLSYAPSSSVVSFLPFSDYVPFATMAQSYASTVRHNRRNRWLLLLCCLLFVLLSAPLTLAQGGEGHVEDLDDDEIPSGDEPMDEQVEEAAEDVYEEMVEEDPPVPEETVDEPVVPPVPPTPAVKEAGDSIVEKIVSKSKKLVDRVKSVSKKDAKKIAAGVVGIWGVSVGVGWLAQQAAKK